MFSREVAKSRIEPSGTPTLTGYFAKTFYPGPLGAICYRKKGEVRLNAQS